MSTNFSLDRTVRLAAVDLWTQFNNTIRFCALNSNKPSMEEVKKLLKENLSKDFTEDETSRIVKVFDDNLIGESTLTSIDMDIAQKIIAYAFYKEQVESKNKDNVSEWDLKDMLHEYGIDTISPQGEAICEEFKKFMQKGT